ncbi:MAG: TRAP transporter large permease subunit [Dehalococcoidia bacterium]|nr:TRAP transporter large permease subunit [Dehalococcoidia bacterium]
MWLSEAAHTVDSVAGRLSRMVNGIGAGVLAAMMFLIAADVVLRYVFNSPIPGALDMSEFMLIIVFFLGVAYVGVKKGHVAVDLVTSRLSPKPREVLSSVTAFLSLLLFSMLIWRTVAYAMWSWETGATSLMLRAPLMPFILLIAFGSLLLAIVLLGDFLNALAKSLHKSRWQVWLWLVLGIAASVLLITIPTWGGQFSGQMSPLTVGLIGIAALFVFLSASMPIGFVMMLLGFLGVVYIRGANSGLNILGITPYRSCSFEFAVIPLFILMGELAYHSRLSEQLYEAAYKWIGQWKGGMAMATIAGCAGFAAVCGENVAVATTMGSVSLPEMKKYRYDPALATGCVASGGTLGVLIPPSLAFILYGLLTQQSIGALFLAGIFPGILMAVLMMSTIYIMCRHNPLLGPPGPRTALKDKLISLKGIWGILALFVLVMGGIYFGVFTPTEGAGIGAFGAFIFIIATRRFSRKNFVASLTATTHTTAMALIILIGSIIFGTFMSVSTLPMWLANWAVALPVPPLVVLIFILFIYLVLGCFMSAIAMLLLTIPVFYPVFVGLGFDPIWAGVLVVIMWNVACITPPVGITVFVIKGLTPDVPMYSIFRGIIPFFFAMIACVAIVIAFPQIATFLPRLLM